MSIVLAAIMAAALALPIANTHPGALDKDVGFGLRDHGSYSAPLLPCSPPACIANAAAAQQLAGLPYWARPDLLIDSSDPFAVWLSLPPQDASATGIDKSSLASESKVASLEAQLNEIEFMTAMQTGMSDSSGIEMSKVRCDSTGSTTSAMAAATAA